MGQRETTGRSEEVPVIFPAIPWLRDGLKYDAYLEKCLESLRSQLLPEEADVLPIYMTPTIEDDVEINRVVQLDLIFKKLKEIVEEFRACSEATHLWILNADNEYPEHALYLLLEHDADLASGISVPHGHPAFTTAFRWVAAPTPEHPKSEPYFTPYHLDELYGEVVGDKGMVGTGHFCFLAKRHLFDKFNFRWRGVRTEKPQLLMCPNCGNKFRDVTCPECGDKFKSMCSCAGSKFEPALLF